MPEELATYRLWKTNSSNLLFDVAVMDILRVKFAVINLMFYKLH